ncbi:TetR/AcrR family transcriptional regulator [Streptococcus sp. HMSC072G04]|jgi:transcriptional regulator-like|uniref:TetR/AcrR family transcriptional regulator n=1 Tax=Streptococcus TaxID=1301 RepID=UPI0008A5CACB|nr:TetR/AcrR family transcriptional regulator [Streptococcus sp. HMSC072G04]OFR12339.1 TetR family transcriptional regulator [Streptococcus sp. HMSC072G04]
MVDLNQACVRHIQLMRLSDKQKRVLIASLTLFSEIGFEKTTSLDIARRAEVSEGTVFSYFKTKEGILNALLLLFFDQVIPETIELFTDQKVLCNDESVTVFFRSMIEDRLNFLINNRDIIKILFSRCLIDSSWFEKTESIVQNNIVTPLNPILDNYKVKGELVNWPNERIIRNIISLMLSYAVPSILNSKAIDVGKVSDEMIEILANRIVL